MRAIITLMLLCQLLITYGQKSVSSPDNALRVSVNGGKSLTITATYKGTVILKPSEIGLTIRQQRSDWTLGKTSTRSVDEKIFPPVPEKRKEIRDHYNELTIQFRSKVTLQV